MVPTVGIRGVRGTRGRLGQIVSQIVLRVVVFQAFAMAVLAPRSIQYPCPRTFYPVLAKDTCVIWKPPPVIRLI